jgi:osmotically-inducible protein OsmY
MRSNDQAQEINMRRDADLKKDVMEELAWDRHIDEALNVSVANGIVTLTGRVGTYGKKLAAERAALRVAGVKGVVEKIEVSVTPEHARTDEEIASAASMALSWNSTVPRNAVKVIVEDGVLILSGEVAGNFQREAAEKAVRHLLGVKAVQNRIEIKSDTVPKDIKFKIVAALHRQAQVDAQNIAVEVENGTVTLSGPVSSSAERNAALHAAWAAPGVVRVVDSMEVAG